MKVFDKLIEARKSYPDNPIMSDEEYDDLLEEYINSDECTPEQLSLLTKPYEVTESGSVAEVDFSIRSVTTKEELMQFVDKFSDETKFKVSIKLNGIRGNTEYVLDHNAEKPYTYVKRPTVSRGTRKQLHQLTQSKLPPVIRISGSTVDSFTVTEEIYCKESDLLEINFRKQYSYTTALAAANSLAKTGVVGNDDLLKVAVHRILHPSLTTRSLEMHIANGLLLPTVPHMIVDKKDVYDAVLTMRNTAIDEELPTDGIVVEADDSVDSNFTLSGGKAAYDDMIAYKPREWVTNTYTSRVTSIKFVNAGVQYTAKVGIEPIVSREGKTLKELDGHNPGFVIFQLGLKVGDYIEFTYNSDNNMKIERRVENAQNKTNIQQQI